jgi:hypothetical protein
MTMHVRCPACGKVHDVSDQMAGTLAKCSCGAIANIPASRSRPAAAEEDPASTGSIVVRCPGCGQQHRANQSMAGTDARCPCGTIIGIPAGPTSPQVDPSAGGLLDDLTENDWMDAAPLPRAPTVPVPAPRPSKQKRKSPRSRRDSGGGSPFTILVIVLVAIPVLGCGGCLFLALGLPAVQATREAGRRAQCRNNLQQIGLAFHQYHDEYECFPPAYVAGPDGQPAHSWRVLLLPYLGRGDLYGQYDFNEPWDSEKNAAVTSRPIQEYCCPSSVDPSTSTETNYVVITGPGTVFEGARPAAFRDIFDGTSNTILVTEVTEAGIPWAKPTDVNRSDITFPEPFAGPKTVGSHHPGGLLVTLCDGSVHSLAKSMPPKDFDALVTRNGDERVDMWHGF